MTNCYGVSVNEHQSAAYVKNTEDKHKIRQIVISALKKAILEFLETRSGQAVKYWPLCDMLIEQIKIPDELVWDFREDFKEAIQDMHREEVLLQSWAPSLGGFVVYPYRLGMDQLALRERTVAALHEVSMKVQYGDDIKS